MPHFKYQRVVTPGPNGTTLYFRNTENHDAMEFSALDGWQYVFVPDGVTMPDQPPEIQWQAVTLTPAEKEQVKAASWVSRMIGNEMIYRIRSVYSIEDEQFFARIGTGVALGVYEFQPGEFEELMAFGAHVEAVRQWGRAERAKVGL